MHMSKRLAGNWLIALSTVALLIGASGGGVARATTPKANKVKQIAIATPEKATDYGWNEQGVNGARTAAAAFGAKLVVSQGIGYDNTESVLRRLATGGANFIIAHASGYATVAPRIAQQYKVPIIVYDFPKTLIKGLVSDVETSSQQGSYLAGVVAASKTKTGTLGIVISAGDPNWYKQSGGFIAGARSIKKNVKFLRAQIGPAAYDDAAGGKRVAQTLIAAGADVFFGMGDGSSFGYLNAAETAKAGHKVWFIDVIGNKTPIDTHHVLLSSVLWDFTPTFENIIRDINNGTFGTHIYNLTASNGISLLRTPYISTNVWNLVERDRHQITAGTIHIPLTITNAAVHSLCSC
jgi:simple sugar transport system substrate-binding protein